jgi:hypothetical protein
MLLLSLSYQLCEEVYTEYENLASIFFRFFDHTW